MTTHSIDTKPSSAIAGLATLLLFSAVMLSPAHSKAAETAPLSLPSLSPAQAAWLGERVFANECASQPSCLTSWNAGEDFPSLGIGHFIWYQRGQQEIFEETFPDLLAHLDARGVALPQWLKTPSPADDRQQPQNSAPQHSIAAEAESPWANRDAFYADIDSDRMRELRDLLANTQAEQAEFIVRRLSLSIPGISAAADDSAEIGARITRIASASPPFGLYALIDYVHFKGTGLAAGERYRGQGWGLLQVLEAIDESQPPIEGFAAAAKRVLSTRVSNAPSERREQRWLAGWHNRLDTYTDFNLAPN